MNTRNKLQKRLEMILPIIILIIIDQSLKIIIKEKYQQREFYFISNILGFKPYKNREYSWINSLGDFGIGLVAHIVMIILIFLGSLFIFDFIKYKYRVGRLEKILYIFLFAGILCSFLDKVVWGGSLDYIWLKHFFIFDLKDVYLTVFEILVILCFIIHYNEIKKLNEKKMYNDFKDYIKLKFNKRINR